MRRRASRMGVAIVLVATLGAVHAAHAIPLDSSLPMLSASPVSIEMLSERQSRAFRISLIAGETLSLSLTPAPGQSERLDIDMYVYGPSSTETSHSIALARAKHPPASYPETLAYVAQTDGPHYLELYAAESSGTATLTWVVLPEPLVPVHRFYNVRSGTHFYTPSETEAASVKATWPHVFRYEGIAYHTKATKNTAPLHRFYNRLSGSHFYTASADEKTAILSRWPSTFTYEGETYAVSPDNGSGTKLAVHRFYNLRNGSHFYTASETEKQTVVSQWGSTYQYEGIAFHLGQ
ncbi:MAG: hypothetical protein ACYC6J_02430 [Coriobacteriia bacterium]